MTLYWCFKCGFHDAILGGSFSALPIGRSTFNHRDDRGFVCTSVMSSVQYLRSQEWENQA